MEKILEWLKNQDGMLEMLESKIGERNFTPKITTTFFSIQDNLNIYSLFISLVVIIEY